VATSSTMKLKIPPAIVLLISVVSMWGIASGFQRQFTFYLHVWVVRFLLGLGILIILIAVITFRRLKTTVDPLHPRQASTLAVIGIYKLSRNPMYVGMLLILIAVFVKFGNYINVGVILGFISYMERFQIKPEEESLANQFGQQYTTYCRKVRRWF